MPARCLKILLPLPSHPLSINSMASMPSAHGLQPGSFAGLACWQTRDALSGLSSVSVLQILRFYEGLGLKLPQQPPLLLVKSAELGNAASREQHPSSDRGAPGSNDAAPVMHTR